MTHPVSVCDARLKALPNYDRFRGLPRQFICSCGRFWVYVDDEAEGDFYTIGNPVCKTTRQNCSWPRCRCDGANWFEDVGYRLVHLPFVLAREFGISTSEARRNIAGGGVRLNDEVVTNLDVPKLHLQGTLSLGKRREVQL